MASTVASTEYVANKAFPMRGKNYLPGDKVNVKDLADHKVSQLLNQRFIRPTTPTNKPGQ